MRLSPSICSIDLRVAVKRRDPDERQPFDSLAEHSSSTVKVNDSGLG